MEDQDHAGGETPSPAAVALAFRSTARLRGTLSAAESQAYRAAVHAMRRKEGRERKWIAEWLDITPGAVSKLLRTKPKATEGAAA